MQLVKRLPGVVDLHKQLWRSAAGQIGFAACTLFTRQHLDCDRQQCIQEETGVPLGHQALWPISRSVLRCTPDLVHPRWMLFRDLHIR